MAEIKVPLLKGTTKYKNSF